MKKGFRNEIDWSGYYISWDDVSNRLVLKKIPIQKIKLSKKV